ncbi:hypothetical protein HXX02_04230 [Microbulbifer elongatus]|uniref:Pectate lyase n=1 Tax=Microbulbifer elongatus TaxID=86173 RepID=A0ABT1NXM7_9GAMM|nr:hypothetical protein [Microbulbifer elongatus]
MSTAPRQPGYSFGPRRRVYQPTFDNDATTAQLHFLARVAAATNILQDQQAFNRGLDLIFSARILNGGWPQSSPLDGG